MMSQKWRAPDFAWPRFHWSLAVVLFALGVGGAVFGYVAMTRWGAREAWCVRRGGIYFWSRDGSVCLKPEAVIQ